MMTFAGPLLQHRSLRSVVIGGSAGSSKVVREILRDLPADYPLPVTLVQHMHTDDGGQLAENLSRVVRLRVAEVLDKMPVRPGSLYVAPAEYHLLVEREGNFALSIDGPIRWSRPSIDVFFQSAALAWGSGVLAILLSGANEDGALGMQTIRRHGGVTVAQEPLGALFPRMPTAAIEQKCVDHILSTEQIAALLDQIGRRTDHERYV